MLNKLGITAIRLDLPFRLNHVNCFMAAGERGWLIIDAGIHNEKTARRWDELIKGKDITDIIVTHYHPDHLGYAGRLQQLTGAQVAMTKVEEDAARKTVSDDFFDLLRIHYKKAAIPKQLTDDLISVSTQYKHGVSPLPHVHHYLEEGQTIVIGNYEYEILHAPGHADGMVCFYNKEESVLLAADHILPKISPNVSYWFFGDDNPLHSYITSLKEMKKREIEFVIPSHGEPFYDANARIDELIDHHDERLEETLQLLHTEQTVYDVCERLFSRTLSHHELRFAIGETVAHLEYLRHEELCERLEVDGKWLYKKK